VVRDVGGRCVTLTRQSASGTGNALYGPLVTGHPAPAFVDTGEAIVTEWGPPTAQAGASPSAMGPANRFRVFFLGLHQTDGVRQVLDSTARIFAKGM